jgi:hypothetical protein
LGGAVQTDWQASLLFADLRWEAGNVVRTTSHLATSMLVGHFEAC